MGKLYFAKFNINSNINEISDDDITYILNKLYNSIDDKKDYKKDVPVRYRDEEGETQYTFNTERYNFSQIDKDDETKSITGWIVRRMPTHTEEFDEEDRVSIPTVLDNTSASTMFYINFEEEIITFTTKGRFGYLQIMDSFEKLFEIYLEDISFKIYLIKNPFDIDEALDRMKVVHKITTTLIPPNAANRSALEQLFEEKTAEFKDTNITSETTTWETDKKNKKGINKSSERFKNFISIIKAFAQRGYGSTEMEGTNSEGTQIEFDFDKDAPYVEFISDDNKDDRTTIIKVSNQGISKLAAKRTLDNQG